MATENDSFTTVSGVISYVQRGPATTTSIPTYAETLEFMALRGALVEAVMATNGVVYTVPNGTSPIPASERTLTYLTKQLNSVLAAVDVVAASEAGEAPSSSDKVKNLMAIAETLEANLTQYLQKYLADTAGTPAVATDISSGGVEAAPYPPSESSRGQVIRAWSLDRKENW
jgi:hypothetical protein